MGKFFSIDSGFMRFMAKVADVIILNFIVLILSMGVITIGPALIALYYVALKEVRDEEGNLLKSYFKSFKQNFLQGVLLEIIIVAIVAFFTYDVYVMYHWMRNDAAAWTKIVFGAICGVAAMVAFGILYVFPMTAKFYNSTGKIIKNSMAMAISNLPYTLLNVIITAFIVFLVYINPYTLMFAIGTWAFLTSIFFNKVFDRYIPKKEEEELPPIEELPQTTMDAPYTASTMNVPPVSDDDKENDE